MKKIIAEDKFGWPVEVTLAEAEGAWIILVDGEFFVSANKTSDEYPDAKVFKDRRSAVEAVKKNNLNKKGRVQIAFNYGYEDEVREVVTEAKKPKVNEKCERCFRQELDGLSTRKLIATFTTVDESDAIDVEPYFNRSLFIDDLVADLDGGDSCSVCESEPLAESAETGDDQSLAGSYEKHALEPMLRKLAVNPAKLIKKVESDEGDQVVRLMKVSHPSHKNMIGIHLNDPSESEIDNAIDAAFRDGFEYIWIHSES